MSEESLDINSLEDKFIVIFDGECAFCNASVRFIRKHNKKDNLLYCAGLSETGQKLTKRFNIDISPNESLIFLKKGKYFKFSTAALEICKELDHFWAMLSFFLIVPAKLRDKVYKFIAKNRISIMGKTDVCSLEDSKNFEGKVLK